jgi:hypothetical protein
MGDGSVRTALYEAAHVILTRPIKGGALKSWAMKLARRAGMKKAPAALSAASFPTSLRWDVGRRLSGLVLLTASRRWEAVGRDRHEAFLQTVHGYNPQAVGSAEVCGDLPPRCQALGDFLFPVVDFGGGVGRKSLIFREKFPFKIFVPGYCVG